MSNPPETGSPSPATPGPVPLPRIFASFFRLGALSWGGGGTLSFMMLDEVTERRRWMTLTEFYALMGVCNLSPGMKLVALTLLIGHRLHGVPGILAAVSGLTIPSFAVIALICAFFQDAGNAPWARGALAGVNGVVVGLMLSAGWRGAEDLLRREAPAKWRFHAALAAAAVAVSLLLDWGPVAVVLMGALAGFASAWAPTRGRA